jgi:hypothetical protein
MKGKWKKEDQKFLIEWFPHWGRKILARELSVPVTVVRNKTNKLKLTLLPKEQRLCFSCRTFFQTTRRNGVYCPFCHRHRRAEVRRLHISKNPIEERLKETLRTLKYRMKRWDVVTDIDLDFLLHLWDSQHGLCFYTSLPMVATNKVGRGRNSDAVSIERIDTAKPYFRSNVVLCSWWANCAKNDLTTEEFQFRCRSVISSTRTCP